MTIILIFGNQGAGKTLYMTKLGKMESLNGKKIFSNYHVNYPHERITFENMLQCKYKDGVLLVDEGAQFGLDARGFYNKNNKELTQTFYTQLRKKNLICIITAQKPRQLDVRIREMSNIQIFCKKQILIENRWCDVIQSQQFAKSIPIKIITWVIHKDIDKDKITSFTDANKYFDEYDSSEVIQDESAKYNKKRGEQDSKEKIKNKNKKKAKGSVKSKSKEIK